MNTPILFSRDEIKMLAEMTTLALAIAVDGHEDDANITKSLTDWENLQQKIMTQAYKDPSLKKSIEQLSDPIGYAFTQKYVDDAFYAENLVEFRESMFWSELVSRMADKAIIDHLGQEQFEAMSEEECRHMSEPVEQALWEECTHHGLDRFGFVLPPLET
ncbi:MAG: hypothetical protein RR250_01530 [Akkermansia sp.]